MDPRAVRRNGKGGWGWIIILAKNELHKGPGLPAPFFCPASLLFFCYPKPPFKPPHYPASRFKANRKNKKIGLST